MPEFAVVLAPFLGAFAGAGLAFWVFGGTYREHRRGRKRIRRLFADLPKSGTFVVAGQMDPTYSPPSASPNPTPTPEGTPR